MSAAPAGPMSPSEFATASGVSRETVDRLADYLSLLRRWQRALNLVGADTLHDPWRRHVLDSAQLLRELPSDVGPVIDLGSGAGLPGLVLAICGVREVHLVESDRRKAAFLREAARLTGAAVEVHAQRVERWRGPAADVVTARAFAPLPRLLNLSAPVRGPSSRLLLHKGKSVDRELHTAADSRWLFEHRLIKSVVDPRGVVLELREVRRASDP